MSCTANDKGPLGSAVIGDGEVVNSIASGAKMTMPRVLLAMPPTCWIETEHCIGDEAAVIVGLPGGPVPSSTYAVTMPNESVCSSRGLGCWLLKVSPA